MKKYALIFAALVTSASLQAVEAAPASSYTVTTDFTYANKYVFRGVELAEGSFQPSVKVTVGDFYAGLWTNQPVTNGTENEVDLYTGYGFKLNDTWALDLGATLYYYPEASTSVTKEYTTEAYVGLNGSLAGLSVGAYVYRDFDWNNYTAQVNVGYSLPLTETASLSLSGNVGRVFHNGCYNYYGAGVAVPVKLNKATTFTVGVNYANHNINDNVPASALSEDNVWYNLGVAVSF